MTENSHISAVIVLEAFSPDDSANQVVWSTVSSPFKLEEQRK